jgi:hypothetical protein
LPFISLSSPSFIFSVLRWVFVSMHSEVQTYECRAESNEHYSEKKIYLQRQMMSIKSRHLLLLLSKISIPICAFLSAFQNLKDASAVEVRSSSSQPASHGFLNCIVSLVVVTSLVIFQGPEQVVV